MKCVVYRHLHHLFKTKIIQIFAALSIQVQELPPLISFGIFSISIGLTLVSYLVREAQTFKLEVVGESTGAAEQYPIGG